MFETLERLSEATPETIEFEAQRAVSIIQISQEIQNVARLKLDIIANNGGLNENFKEIGHLAPNTTPLLQESSDTKDEVPAEETELFTFEEEEEPTEEATDDNEPYYKNTFIEKHPIPTDKNGHYLTEEKRAQLRKPNQNRK